MSLWRVQGVDCVHEIEFNQLNSIEYAYSVENFAISFTANKIKSKSEINNDDRCVCVGMISKSVWGWNGLGFPQLVFLHNKQRVRLCRFTAQYSHNREPELLNTKARNLHNRLFVDVLNILISFLKTASIINIIFNEWRTHWAEQTRKASFYFHLW